MDSLTAAKFHRHLSVLQNIIQSGAGPEAKADAAVGLMHSMMFSEVKHAHHTIAASQNSLVQAAVQKTGVDPMLLTDEYLGEGPLRELFDAYLATRLERSILDILKSNGARTIPQNVGRALIATGVDANTTGEGQIKAVMTPGLSSEDATRRKVTGVLVMSDELAREAGTDVFERELNNDVARTCNAGVMDIVVDSTSPTATDLSSAIALAGLSDNYIVAIPAGEVASLAVTNAGTGPGTLGVTGGWLCPGVYIVAVDDITDTVVIPTSRCAIRDYGLQVRPAAHATIELDTSPVGGESAVMTSLWQHNFRGLLIEREFELACDPSEIVVIEEGS